MGSTRAVTDLVLLPVVPCHSPPRRPGKDISLSDRELLQSQLGSRMQNGTVPLSTRPRTLTHTLHVHPEL